MVRLIFLLILVVFCLFLWGEVVFISGGLIGFLLRFILDNLEIIKGFVFLEKEIVCLDEGDWSLLLKRGWIFFLMIFVGGLLCFLYLVFLIIRKF